MVYAVSVAAFNLKVCWKGEGRGRSQSVTLVTTAACRLSPALSLAAGIPRRGLGACQSPPPNFRMHR